MTSRYIDLADRIGEGAEYSNTTSFCLGIECALRWLDEHSDQAPGRTITESRYRALTDSDPEEYRSGFSDGFFFAGGCIVPDPAAEWAQAALDALEAVLKVHTPIEVNHAFKGRTNVCEQCSEDRLYALWPCETVEAIEGAINHE